jgi:hypothetical protein
MILADAISQAREKKRSKVLAFACKAGEIETTLDWLTGRHGNKTILELLKEREKA